MELKKWMEQNMKYTDTQIEELNQTGIKDGNPGKFLSPFHVPFLDSNLNSIAHFSVATQQALLDIRTQLEFLNDQTGHTRQFQDMTFTLANEELRTQLTENLIVWFVDIEKRARKIADQLGSLKIV